MSEEQTKRWLVTVTRETVYWIEDVEAETEDDAIEAAKEFLDAAVPQYTEYKFDAEEVSV